MISQVLEMRIKQAYSAIDEAYVQASKDSYVLINDKQTNKALKVLGEVSVKMDKIRWSKKS